jgi:ABC-type multidrug transport system ATPase subunit
VISTHLLEEVESFVDEAIFIKAGEVFFAIVHQPVANFFHESIFLT